MNDTRRRPLLRFIAVGLLNTAVGLATVLIAGQVFGVGAFAANAIGLATGFVVGYQVNRLWTFSSTASIAMTAPRYLLAFAIAYALNSAILAGLLRLSLLPTIFAQAVALSAYSLAFYLLCRRAVFPASGR